MLLQFHGMACACVCVLQQRAQVLTVQKRSERQDQMKAEKTERLEASNARKKEMQELEMKRRLSEKPSDLEQVGVCVCISMSAVCVWCVCVCVCVCVYVVCVCHCEHRGDIYCTYIFSLCQEAQEKSLDLLAKARAQMEEQDDEIKKLNEAILNAKCHAIRDAQLREGDEIIRAMQEEDVRQPLQ